MIFHGLCQWCREEPLKAKKNKTCSRSCGSSLRWFKLMHSGKLLIFNKRSEYARRQLYCKRIRAECEKHCKELNITMTSEVLKLYTRGRNRGYLNGWSTASKRISRRRA